MTPEVRAKLRKARLNSGKGKTYTKLYGRHEHRVVAEQMLGRPLKRENLIVLPSQKEHAQLHAKLNKFFAMGGDA